MFRNSITLFRLFGFRVGVDASWLLLAVLVVWSLAVGYFPWVAPGHAARTYWLMGVAGLIGLAFSIVFHELAHALVARRYHMPIRGITLFIFGGVAEMEEEPTSAKAEFWMALAGPAMSFLVAAVFWLAASAFAGPAPPAGELPVLAPSVAVLAYLAFINGVLAVFNLVPAFPLDGGRILRAALWGWRGDILWATRVAASAGSLFGFALIVLGLFTAITGNVIGGVWWFVIGLFVRAAAAGHLQHQTHRSVLAGVPVARFMRRDLVTVPPDLPLDRLVRDYALRHYYKEFPVTRDGKLVGCAGLAAIKALGEADLSRLTVTSIMHACDDDNTVGPDADSAGALAQMQRTGKTRLLVVHDGELVGILALRDLLNFLAIRTDLETLPPAAKDTLRRETGARA